MNEKLKQALIDEENRQRNTIELIASENFVSQDILRFQGSILTNKYAEGYPNKRYYEGCEYIDVFEEETIRLACELFNCKYANVQPHSGSSANMAVFRALLNHGDKIMGLSLAHGGHLTHGYKINFSGIDYDTCSYELKDEVLDYTEIMKLALALKPKLIIAGASAYSREIDFSEFRKIADRVGAYLLVDMAHIAGLVATDLHMSPLPYADVVTSTTHKTLRGPRGGLILTNNEEIAKKINKVVFPGIQGGPLMHVIAAKAQCFYEALQPSFSRYQKQVILNSKVLAKTLEEKGLRVVSGGTDNHLMLVDLSVKEINGHDASILLSKIGITVNKNMIPNDKLSPSLTSGIRLGTAAMTTRGFNEEDFAKVGEIIFDALSGEDLNQLSREVKRLVNKYVN